MPPATPVPGPDLCAEAFEAGCAFYKLGRFEQARHWLKVAARRHHPHAVAKLAEVNALCHMLDSIDFGDAALDAFLSVLEERSKPR